MTHRINTRQVRVGSVAIGGGARISVQSMTNTRTSDVDETLAQIRALASAGADIVRVTVNDQAAADAVRALVGGSPVPPVADVHYNASLAVRAVENGAAKLRINPGNMGGEDALDRVAACCKAHNVPIRVGANGGSLKKSVLEKYGGPTAEALAESALEHVRMLEMRGFEDIVVAVKSSSAPLSVSAYRLMAKKSGYPLHIGVTEAGLPEDGRMRSAVGIGALLLDGIGDTIRVSLTGDPLPEIEAALDILRACELLRDGVRVVSCPTCGRCEYDMTTLARQIRDRTRHIAAPLTVAVMGCVVNGPGEAREADVGVAGGGKGRAALLIKGQPSRPIDSSDALALLMREIERLAIKEEQ